MSPDRPGPAFPAVVAARRRSGAADRGDASASAPRNEPSATGRKEKRAMLNPDHPFFRPLWVRIATVAVALGWALVELSRGALFWAGLFGAAGLYAAYQLFVVRKSEGEPDETDE
jgi:hypothetical protein